MKSVEIGKNLFRNPFNWKTPLGYAITFSIQFGAWTFLLKLCCCILCFFGGVCWLLIAFIEDINSDIKNLNKIKRIRENDMKFSQQLVKIIHFHSTAKQLSLNLKLEMLLALRKFTQ